MLKLCRAVTKISHITASITAWGMAVSALLGASHALLRKFFLLGSNAVPEAQWALVTISFLGCAASALHHHEHVRIELVHKQLPQRWQQIINKVALLCFTLPMCAFLAYWGTDFFVQALVPQLEISPNAGGLPVGLFKIMLPAAFFWLFLQALAELIVLCAPSAKSPQL